jgi:hydantoinase/carbamoylase family amidase
VELMAFSEEEGVRFSAPYLGSTAIAGCFDRELLARQDASGVRLVDVLADAGFNPAQIDTLAYRPQDLAGYIELHIEQGPVLLTENIPVGVVTGIAAVSRFGVSVAGAAGHAGTTPMNMRRDACAAAAEMILFVERRCSQQPGLVGTVGRIGVPDGAINVIPGRCEFSLDVRAGDDATLAAAVADIRAEFEAIAKRRGVSVALAETHQHKAVPCSPHIQQQLARAIERAGIKPRYLPSGAGHDAGILGSVTDSGMLFVRCGNGGVSHSPLETVMAEDVDVATRILIDTIENFEPRA